jgi:histidinol-phosphate aminotransferase
MNNGKRPSPRPAVLALSPYVPGKPIEEVEAEYGITGAVKLASNENPLGPSPRALAAAHAALAEVHRYPDGSGTALRRALSKKYGVPEAGIVLGSGGSEILDLAVRTFVDPGEEVLIPDKIFRMVPVAAGRAGACSSRCSRPRAQARSRGARAARGTGNEGPRDREPQQPDGLPTSRATSFRFLRAHSCPTCSSCSTRRISSSRTDSFPTTERASTSWPKGTRSVVRTLSKSAGLAGLRIGFGFAPVAVADAIHRVRERSTRRACLRPRHSALSRTTST